MNKQQLKKQFMRKGMNPYQVKGALKKAARLGRGGDDRIAHINATEAAALKAMGGSGGVNPATGLQEFSPMGGQSGGSDGTGSKGPGGGGQSSGDRRDRNLKDLKSLEDRDWSPDRAERGGSLVGPGAGVAPFSRSTTRKIAGFDELTGENALRLGGAIASTLAGPAAAAANMIAGAATIDDPMNPYGKPDRQVDYTSADSPNRLGEAEAEREAERKRRAARRPSTVLTPPPGATWLGGGLKLVSET